LASNGRGVVREVRVAVFAVIPRHDDERTNDSYYAYVAFSFAQRSFFFVLFLSSSLRFFVTSPKDVHKVPKMMFGVCKNPPSQKAWERGEREREKRPAREKGRERERERERRSARE